MRVELRGGRFGQLFPWPGGKRRVAAEVWARLGDPGIYLEPFFGSGGVLLCRPGARPARYEHVNDADGHVVNAWRAVRYAPVQVAEALASLPHDELTVAAWGRGLVRCRETLRALLLVDPQAHDVDLAVGWLQGQCCWLGWGWPSDRGQILTRPKGVLSPSRREDIRPWLDAYAARLAGVQISCGDWSRIVGRSFTRLRGVTAGVFLDPPYRGTEGAYAEATPVASEVEAWCREHGQHPGLRIVLAGHADDYDLPGWEVVAWERYRGQGNDAGRATERLWCSPACLRPDAPALDTPLFSEAP